MVVLSAVWLSKSRNLQKRCRRTDRTIGQLSARAFIPLVQPYENSFSALAPPQRTKRVKSLHTPCRWARQASSNHMWLFGRAHRYLHACVETYRNAQMNSALNLCSSSAPDDNAPYRTTDHQAILMSFSYRIRSLSIGIRAMGSKTNGATQFSPPVFQAYDQRHG